MPFYEYSCPSCKFVTTEFRSISERDDEVLCEECKKSNLVRSISLLSQVPTPNTNAKTRVDSFIKKAKSDLKGEKKDLSRRTK